MYLLIILLVSVGFQNQSENLETFFFWVSLPNLFLSYVDLTLSA